MMNIVLNGQDKEIEDNTSIEQLLKNIGMDNKRLAVEVNQTIVPRGNFSSNILKEKDKVEIVQAIGGGANDTTLANPVIL